MRELKIKLPLFLLLFFVAGALFSQQKELHGQITNTTDVEGIHILNQSSRFNAVSNKEGVFTITAKVNDTILVSSVTYVPQLIIVSEMFYNQEKLNVTLEEIVNELAEVKLGNQLTGNLNTDLQNIKTKKILQFDDVGIPGFKGKPEEKIVPVVPSIGLIVSVDVEALYKHLSGYYKTLKTKRKWESQNQTVAGIINFYGADFFRDAYTIPENRLYDFLLFCMETETMEQDFKKENYSRVIATLEAKAGVYIERISDSIAPKLFEDGAVKYE